MGTRIFFFFKCAIPNRYNLRNRGLRHVHLHIHIHLYCSNMMFTQILRRKQMLQRVPSPFSIRSRDNLHTSSSSSSSSGTGARVHQGLGSRGNVRMHRAQVIRGSGGFVHRAHALPPCLPSLAVLRALSYAVNFDGFPPFHEASW